MPDGLSSARLPSRVSVSVADPADTSERLDTPRMAASSPDIVQSPAPDVPAALTGSSKETRISRSETATALSTRGAWPSARCRENAAFLPSGLPAASASAVWFMVSVPVAFAAAAVSGRKSPNSRTCVADPFPVNTAGTPRSPPGVRPRPAYADAPM